MTAGGALFGMGYVVNGYCPGTAVAGLAYAYACVFASAGYACDALLIFDLLVPACPGQDIFFHTGFPRFTPPHATPLQSKVLRIHIISPRGKDFFLPTIMYTSCHYTGII